MRANAKLQLSTLCAAGLLLALLPRPAPVYAANFSVTTTTDSPHSLPLNGNCTSQLAGNPCTLRAAIQAVNFLGGGPHTVNLSVAGTYTLSVTGSGEDNGATGDLDINGANLTIANTSGGIVRVSGPGGPTNDRVFDVGPQSAAQVAISGVTIQNGSTSFAGGVRTGSGSTLTLTNVTVSGNTATVGGGGGVSGLMGSTLTFLTVTLSGNMAANIGGGLENDGTATLTDVTLSGNSAGDGGGLGNTGMATLTNVTLNGNSASNAGGGIASTLDAGALTLTNVTISGNTAAVFGGGIFKNGAATLTNVTLSSNAAPSSGGIANNGGSISLKNTIVASGPTGENCAGTITSLGSNLSTDGSCSAAFTAPGDLNNANAGLGPLQVNAPGNTATHALLPGSQAIEAVFNQCPPPATDQRGIARPQGVRCDIGAFELQNPPPLTPTPSPTVTPTATPTCILGDINCDGIVDIRDYGIWRQNFGQTNCGNRADLNNDCIVDIRDYGIWRANFGHTAGAAAQTATPVATPRSVAATPTPMAGRTQASGESGSAWGVIRKAAQARGLTFPNEMLLRVTEVIQ